MCHNNHTLQSKFYGCLFSNIDVICLLSRFNQCYGVLGVLDRLHGTDLVFKQTKAYDRHILLLNFTPLTQSIPELTKKSE